MLHLDENFLTLNFGAIKKRWSTGSALDYKLLHYIYHIFLKY